MSNEVVVTQRVYQKATCDGSCNYTYSSSVSANTTEAEQVSINTFAGETIILNGTNFGTSAGGKFTELWFDYVNDGIKTHKVNATSFDDTTITFTVPNLPAAATGAGLLIPKVY